MHDLKTWLSAIAVVLTFVAYIPYLKDTILGKTQPHVYSWLLWGFVTMLVFALQFTGGGGAGSLVTLFASLICLLIFILGVKQGNNHASKSDKIFFAISILAIIFWLAVKQPNLSTILLTSTGIFALIPTIRKAWNKPYTETLSMYFINSFRHTLILLALTNYSVQTALHPSAWAIANGLVGIILVFRRKIIKL